MNPMLPVTSLLPLNAQPTRQMVVSDPEKLTYFNRAAMIRAGVQGTWGALGGLGDVMPALDANNSANVQMGGAFQTIGDFMGSLGRNLLGATPVSPSIVPESAPPMDHTPYIIAGVAAVGIAGFVAYKMLKKK